MPQFATISRTATRRLQLSALRGSRAVAFGAAAIWLLSATTFGQVVTETELPEEKAVVEPASESPWLLVPTFSVNPKLGASVGAIAAFLHYFDEDSGPSMFGVGAQYTSTDSVIASLFGRASWDRDHQRAIALVAGGNIKNDYDDYLGTGVPLRTNDELRAFVARDLYRISGDWFVGVQGTYTNYQLLGESSFDDQVLDVLGLQGYKSGGIGGSIYHDSRDNENSPSHGFLLNLNNIAYCEWIAGSDDFDVYRADTRAFFPQAGGSVLAIRQFNQLTDNAPAAAFAPVQLRGYKVGQYLAQYMSSIEVEERLRLGERWTATLLTGVAFLYGDTPVGNESNEPFPTVGGGFQYVLKVKEGIVLGLETAVGRDDNYGVFIKLGYGW